MPSKKQTKTEPGAKPPVPFDYPFVPDEEGRRSPTGTLPKRDDSKLFDGDEPLF